MTDAVRPLLQAITIALIAATATAHAETNVEVHGLAGGARTVIDPQQTEFGFGGTASVALEVLFAQVVGLQIEAAGAILAPGNSTNSTLVTPGIGTLVTGMGGIRLHPFGRLAVAGLWLDGNGGVGLTGNVARPAIDAHLGYDFWVGSKTSRLDIGPFAGYAHIFQPSTALQPQDAHVVSLGLHLAFGRPDEVKPPPPPPPPKPVRRDRDKDTVFDDEDACPDEPGIRTTDPKTNGCPRSDRDKDTVFDDEDACPDEPGVRTTDPKTNGCPPPDRDGDGIADSEDACPDVPGVRTTDPKTNGCPPAVDSVHVVGDRIVLDDVILFDVNKSRVRPESRLVVKKIAEFIKNTPDIVEVYVEGHADQMGGRSHNLKLSIARATTVRKMLIEFGVEKDRIATEGLGKARPKAQGTSEQDRSLNRRVEFTITRARAGTSKSVQPPAAPPAPEKP